MNKPIAATQFGTDVPFDDNPEWTEDDFARARPASEVLPGHIAAALVRTDPLPEQEEVVLELDHDVLAKFRATGPGWQARINAALKAASV